VVTAAPALALDPRDELFRCEHYRCTLRRAVCLERRAEVVTIRATRRKKPVFEFCGSGACEQGAANEAELGAAPARVQVQLAIRRPTFNVFKPVVLPATPISAPEVAPVPATKPEHTAASLAAVMTDKKCACGCGRALRKNNATGYSGYCNAAKFAAGNRERPSRAKKASALAVAAVKAEARKPVVAVFEAPPASGLPPVEDLPEPYLAQCVREARRRLACAKVLEEALAS
jgi:hypothetical protein